MSDGTGTTWNRREVFVLGMAKVGGHSLVWQHGSFPALSVKHRVAHPRPLH